MCHDWARDEFARRLWCTLPLDLEGKVWFAAADGWRGVIDDAIEQGCRVVWSVVNSK